MAKFGHPDQHEHMLKGLMAAHASPRTPAHLKPHIAQRITAKKLRVSMMPHPETEVKPMPWNEVMSKFKAGTLKSGGSGKKVKSRKQAIAILLSEKKKAKTNPEYRPRKRDAFFGY